MQEPQEFLRTEKNASRPNSPSSPAEGNLDRDVIAKILQGDREAFRYLVEKYQRKVFNIALGYVGGDRDRAADAAQEIFVKVYRGLKSFQEQSLFSTWLHRIAVNHMISQLRRDRALKRGQKPISLDSPLPTKKGDEMEVQVGDEKEEPTRRLVNEEKRVGILRAVEELEEELRSVVVLCDLQGLLYEDAAQALGIPIGTVRSRLHRAREQLRVKLRTLF